MGACVGARARARVCVCVGVWVGGWVGACVPCLEDRSKYPFIDMGVSNLDLINRR